MVKVIDRKIEKKIGIISYDAHSFDRQMQMQQSDSEQTPKSRRGLRPKTGGGLLHSHPNPLQHRHQHFLSPFSNPYQLPRSSRLLAVLLTEDRENVPQMKSAKTR